MTVDSTECETCWYYDYDEEYDEYYCMMELDGFTASPIPPPGTAPFTGRATITPLQGDNR